MYTLLGVVDCKAMSSLGSFLSFIANSCLVGSVRRVKPILSLDMTTFSSLSAGCLPGLCPFVFEMLIMVDEKKMC